MPPNDELPLSKNDKLADVDAELESAMNQLDETSERVDRAIVDFEEGAEDLEAEDSDKAEGEEEEASS